MLSSRGQYMVNFPSEMLEECSLGKILPAFYITLCFHLWLIQLNYLKAKKKKKRSFSFRETGQSASYTTWSNLSREFLPTMLSNI